MNTWSKNVFLSLQQSSWAGLWVILNNKNPCSLYDNQYTWKMIWLNDTLLKLKIDIFWNEKPIKSIAIYSCSIWYSLICMKQAFSNDNHLIINLPECYFNKIENWYILKWEDNNKHWNIQLLYLIFIHLCEESFLYDNHLIINVPERWFI